ncbi:potassium channel family protein [Kitasatospora sp. NPDC051914]|uniref:potassium channel family protein n=1 Tax=Kitasatospora sp. NPDC051914 TaxID=3154945 RepID=UPI0034223FFF
MRWLLNVAGAVLVLAALRDVFHTLWHPTRHGGLSRLVMASLWRLSGALPGRRRSAGLAGPLAMVAVVGIWALAVVLGWALIYWPHMPDAFTYAAGLRPAEHAEFVDALYLSLVHLTTLGLGDIAPAEGWLRILTPLEALVGFALLTATVSWTLGIYPALARRRALALRLSHLSRTYPTAARVDADADADAAILEALAAETAVISVDLMQYAESYYFYDGDDRTSLARHIAYAQDLAERAVRARHPDVRPAAAAFRAALEDLAIILDQRFLRTGGTTREIFDAFARDHGRHHGH